MIGIAKMKKWFEIIFHFEAFDKNSLLMIHTNCKFIEKIINATK